MLLGLCFIIEQDRRIKVIIIIAGDDGVGKSSIIRCYTTGSYLSDQNIRSHYQDYQSTNTLYYVCVCVCYLQHGSEVYMRYITFGLQMIEKMQPIINPLLGSNC